MSKKRIYVLVLLLILTLTACDRSEKDDIPPPSQAGSNRSTYDWMTEDWKHSDEIYAGGTFYVEKYISGLEYRPEQEYEDHSCKYRCWGSNFYVLDEFSTLEDSSSQKVFYLSGYEDATGEIWHRRLELPELEEYKEAEKRIYSFEIQNPQEYILFVQVLEEENPLAYLAMHFTLDGEFLGAADLYPAIQASGLTMGKSVFPYVYIDHEGRYFFTPFSGERIVVLDADGKQLTELSWDKEDSISSYVMKSAQGDPVFEQYCNRGREMRLILYDSAIGGERVFTDQLPVSTPKGITGDGVLYYGDRGRLYRWDLYTGDMGVCFNYDEAGLGRNDSMTYIAVSDTGFPIIMDFSREKAVICKLDDKPGEEGEPVRLVSLTKDNSFVNACAIMFSQEHTEHPILMQQPEGSLADFRTRALADLIAGNGADIYYVSGEDMRMLYEKGVLADLSGVLDNDDRKSLYEGALSCGVIDGRQMGLPPEAYVTTLLVSDELWPGDSWTLEDILAVMEEHPEITKIMTSHTYMAKSKALYLLLLQDLQNSPFIDMETGTCDFDNPLFIKALEIINEASGGNDDPSVMKDGKVACFQPDMESFVEFSDEMSRMGEGFHTVGFPTEGSGGSYWNADYFLVVNAGTEHRELIDAYLASLFTMSRQRELSQPIRKDILETSISYVDYYPTDYPWQYSIGGGVFRTLHTKPDGSPWTSEYKGILDQAVSRPQNTNSIEDIVLEEAATYLSGVKTAEQAAEIIQNRVQLYLNEQQ